MVQSEHEDSSRSRSASSVESSLLSEDEVDQSEPESDEDGDEEAEEELPAPQDGSKSPDPRAHSPTSPKFSPSTPTPHDSCDGATSEADLLIHMASELQPATATGSMPCRNDSAQPSLTDKPQMLKTSGDTNEEEAKSPQQETSPSTLQPEHNQDHIDSDRKAQFEETSSRARQAARQNTELTSNDGREGEDSKRGSSNAAKQETCQEQRKEAEVGEVATVDEKPKEDSHESHSPEGRGEHTAVEQKVEEEATPLRVQASWVSEAYSACTANRKVPPKKGDSLVITDPNEMSKTYFFNSYDLGKASEPLAKLDSAAEIVSHGCISEQGLTRLYAFSAEGTTPEFYPLPLDCSFTELLESAGLPRPAQEPKTRHQTAEKAKVKVESEQTTAASGPHSVASNTDWSKACESFLRIISRERAHGISRKDPAVALPQIEGVIDIAQKYRAIREVQSDFDSLFFGYVGSGKFWELIAEVPVRCIRIGIALKNIPVYHEAFKHLVGSSSNLKAGLSFHRLSADVQAIIHRRSRELYNLRRDVNEDLLLITLPATKKKKSAPPVEYPSSAVSQHDQFDAYSTVNIFRDWISEHVGYLRCESPSAPPPFYLCDHKGRCDMVAGFYRAIAAGGDAYMPIDKIWESFNENFLENANDEDDCANVKKSLAALKDKASKHVAELVKSTLHLPGKDELDYLTCVTVKEGDVPWDDECKDKDDDDMDMD